MSQITVPFTVDGINDLIKQLENYEKKLNDANRKFLNRLAEIGVIVINSRLSCGSGDSDRSSATFFEVTPIGDNKFEGKLTLAGGDVVFWEFGAGIHYNNGNANPLAKQNGMGVGTYPNQKFALNPNGWWYRGEDGNLHHSLGTEATMPLYSATVEIQNQIIQIAKEVFGSVI